MTTQLIKVRGLMENFDDFVRAGNILKNGEVVAIPTETVYGLAASAFSPDAVGKIFKAKGRPQDNPLIVHISDFDDLAKITEEVPESAIKLAENFWPGPLTMILKKNEKIPLEVTAGLSTVAVRFRHTSMHARLLKRRGFRLRHLRQTFRESQVPQVRSMLCAILRGKYR